MSNKNHYPTLEKDRIPLSQKIVFGIGMLANQMFPAALGIFMVILVEGLGMHPLMFGLLAFIPRLFDAITDPIMGFITDNTTSRWGKRRPYVFIGAIIAGLSYVMMWQLSEDSSQLYNFFYFLGWSLIFFLGMTIFSIPYVAMGYEMSNDFHERTRLMATAQWIGQWAWVICPWFWVILYDPNWFESAPAGAKSLSLWVGLGCMCLALVPAIFCTYNNTSSSAPVQTIDRKKIKETFSVFIQGIVTTFKCKPFRKICLATFLVFNTFNTIAMFSFFIIVHYMNGGVTADAGLWPTLFGSVSALLTCFLVIPTVTWLSQKFGKKQTFLLSQAISIIGYVLFWWCFSPENPALMFIPLPFYTFGIGGLFTIMMSMTADVCDLDELETGQRRDGTFGAIYWWMVKFGLAVAGLLTGIILSLVGFDTSLQVQTQEAMTGLRLAYILVPVCGTLLAILIMRSYDIDEEKAHSIREQLEARRGALAAS
ncbi:MFS transporter [Pseudomonadales bacterium]|jgi:GPH family glycoside/pentoside/hexuronide:cation symporter|nr:MFS transporter [Pseudomonadales bacterium]MDB4362649.1 MFS transporter [Pseudomonadales bacterium]MDB4420688.1 MFS transporter [Pseudomonadales bacterium]MDB4452854.1 MFS transporter [bacterium]